MPSTPLTVGDMGIRSYWDFRTMILFSSSAMIMLYVYQDLYEQYQEKQ